MAAIPSINPADERIIRSFLSYEGKGEPGFIIDFLGVKTRVDYFSGKSDLSGHVEGYPLPWNFHANSIEFAGVLRSALEAKDRFVAVELGAGWGPWLLTGAAGAKQRGIESIHLVGVEGSQSHFEYLQSHLRDNGYEPEAHTLLHGVVGCYDGTAEFPLLTDPSLDWGAEARFDTAVQPVGSLETLLKPCDFGRVDIRGEGFDVIARDPKDGNVNGQRLTIQTRSRSIEERLMGELTGRSWVLESEEASRFVQRDENVSLHRDGCQVWRNVGTDEGAITRMRRALKTRVKRLLKPFDPRRKPVRVATVKPMEKVRCFSIEALLKPYERVDVVHVDIQGAEYEVIAHAREVLKRKVRRLVIGTHGRSIEERLMGELAGKSWVLESEEASLFEQRAGNVYLHRDGCQVWRNVRFDEGIAEKQKAA